MPDDHPAGTHASLSAALAPVALAVVRPNGRITVANDTWETLTGWPRATVETKRLQDLVTPGAGLFLETHCLPVAAAGTPVEEAAIEIVGPDARRVPMLLYARRDPVSDDLYLALAPARQRHAQQAELRSMRERERRSNDLQLLVAQLSERALGGLEPAQLSDLAARGLHDLLPAELAAVIELTPAGASLTAAYGLAAPDTEPPAGTIELEVASARAHFATGTDPTPARQPRGLAALVAEPGGAEVVSLRAPVGAAEDPDAILAVHRRGAQRYTSFEIGAVQAVAQTLSTAFRRYHEVEAAQHRAAHDQLTGLTNRHQLLQKLDDALRAAQTHGTRPGLLYLDLDGFKKVNDSFGHDAGDRLLQAIAGRLRDAVRGRDTVARLGGDEFVVLCPDMVTFDAAERVVARIDGAFDEPFTIAGTSHMVRASVGLAFPASDSSPEQALAIADAAMYRSKALRRAALNPPERESDSR